jgi:hypothetical protein
MGCPREDGQNQPAAGQLIDVASIGTAFLSSRSPNVFLGKEQRFSSVVAQYAQPIDEQY